VAAVRITDVYVRANWKTGVVPISVPLHNKLSKPSWTRLHFVVTDASVPQIVLNRFHKRCPRSG